MNEEELIKNICFFLEMLITEDEADMPWALRTQNKQEAFLCSLEKNMHTVLTESTKHDTIKRILQTYVRHPADVVTAGDRYWNFTLMCLTLVKGLNEALLSLEQQVSTFASAIDGPPIPRGTLSIKQQKAVRKALQFIIALGVFPNLIPGVRSVIRRRTEAIAVVENYDLDSNVQQKYYRLLTSILVLLECLNQKCLQAVVLTHFAGDILTALLQLCHAPIKRVDGFKDAYEKLIITNATTVPGALEANIVHYSERYQDFNWVMSKLRTCATTPEAEFVLEMWEDRPYFLTCLNRFLKLVHPSTLMWQLIFLQGSSMGNAGSALPNQIKIPPFLAKVANQVLTDKLLEPDGVKILIQVAFDRMSDVDIETGVITRERLDAVAHVISFNPAKHIPIEFYMKDITNQLYALMHLKSTPMSQIFSSVASSALVQFAQRSFELAEEFISLSVLRPFWFCLSCNEREIVSNGHKIANEESITMCIEDAHEIFINNQSAVLSSEAMKLLLPFYHFLFVMYVKLLNSISFLKTKVRDLLLAILNGHCTEDTVKLLRTAAFEDIRIPNIHVVSNLKCIFGGGGGIEVIKCTDRDDPDVAENIEVKCQAIHHLLQRISDRKVEAQFFMLLLKKSTHLLSEEGSGFIQKDEVGVFVDNLVSIRIIEDLGENIAADMFKDIDEAIELIKAALECGINADMDGAGPPFSEETMLSFLVILSTMIGYKDELNPSHWRALKQCLSPLEKLVNNSKQTLLKEMADDICTAIRTHGAVLSNVTKQQKPLLQQNKVSTQKVSERIKNIQRETQNRKNADARKLIEEVNTIVLNDRDLPLADKPEPPPAFSDLRWSSSAPLAASSTGIPSPYLRAMTEVGDSSIPVRGHGLISLAKLIEARDEEALFHKEEVFDAFQKNLLDDDSYIYLPSIHGLSALGNVDPKLVLPLLLSEFKSCRTDRWSYTLKVGEALLKTCHNLGDLTTKFRDEFLTTYLIGVRHQDPHIRASSLSNLGEVCKALRFSVGPMLQEILLCVISVLKTDPIIEVRRAAVLVVGLLLQGTGKDTFTILENEIKDLYSLLRYVYTTEKDEGLRLQAQLALEELNRIVKEAIQQASAPPLVKEIRVLDPF